MKILLVNQFFWPDSAATSQLLTDVARELSERGHEVHTISADQGYALMDETNRPRVNMHRVNSLRFMRGTLGRILSYASFFVGCAWQGLRVPRPDVVITLTTPPLLSLVGNLIRLFRGSRHFIWEMDIYPDVAVDLGYIARGGLIDRIVGAIADFSRVHSDGILALGPCMRDRLVERGIPLSKIHIAENWSDSAIIFPTPWPAPEAALTILYSGNLGLAHDVSTISDAMVQLRENSSFEFIFAGSGARRPALEQLCRTNSIANAAFRPYSPKADLGKSLGSGHIGLITQQDSCVGSVVPSKVYGLLAAGRPILFIGPKQSTVAKTIECFHCGWQIDCGDAAGLVTLLKHLEQNRSYVEEVGARSRQVFLENYDLVHGVSRICALIGAPDTKSERHSTSSSVTSDLRSEEKRFANVG